MSDAETPKDVESTLDVFHPPQGGVQCITECVRLMHLGARRSLEKQPGCACADKISERGRERGTEIHFTDAIFGLEVRLDRATPTQAFTSFEAYANAVQSANLRAIFRGPKRANWVLSYLTSKNLAVQWAQAGGPAMMEGTVKPGGLGIVMPYRNAQALSMNGRRFDDFSLMVLRPGDEFCSSAADCNSWFSIFVPDEMLADMSRSAMAAIRSSQGAGPVLWPELLTRAIVDKSVCGGHGGQGVGAGDKSLIEGIVLQGIGVDVVHVLGSLHILIGQTLHVIELVD